MEHYDNIVSIMSMMAQWQECKTRAKEALLLFRLGDFYEAFYEDAEVIAKEIQLTLTARQGVPMCGVPYHSAETYIDKLIAKGYRIAVAEQLSDPKETKGLIKREIIRTITPGTIVTSALLKENKNNFFASVVRLGKVFGLGLIDLTTGEFRAFELETEEEILDELFRLKPAEFLASKAFQEAHPRFFKELSFAFALRLNERPDLDRESATAVYTAQFQKNPVPPAAPLAENATAVYTAQFQKSPVPPAALLAAANLLAHLKQELQINLDHVTHLVTESLSQFLAIDRATMRNLELTEGENSLLKILDETATAMGGRLLRKWTQYPLLSCPEIEKRQEAVAAWLEAPELRRMIQLRLAQIRDLERLITRISARYATPRDLFALGSSLAHLPYIEKALSMTKLAVSFFDAGALSEKILRSLVENPPLRMGDGEIFREGIQPELDQLRRIARDSSEWMNGYQTRLREETGIKTLKVGYTRAFGYYIEVSRAQTDKIPLSFHRRQTLVNGERYTTEELKQFEHQFLTAEERAKALETELFETLRREVASFSAPIHAAAKTLARLDVLLSFAIIAERYRFTRPVVDNSDVLEIKEGRHPIVERSIGTSSFISNDTLLSAKRQMMLITGPNMAGKSTYIRQVALIVILAQMGSYVPATSARVGLIDRIFSRIGASDDLARGQSTFMVEMSETANILHHATNRSLVLLDEIGRGTSTYDGISIAWAVAEFLLTKVGAKTLFATHYWELTRLEAEYPHAMNFQIAVKEIPSGIVFLRKIIPGGTDKSYGIHVARLAGLPPAVLQRAEERLRSLEAQNPRTGLPPAVLQRAEERLRSLEAQNPRTGLPPAVLQRAEERLRSLEAQNPQKRDEQLSLFIPAPPEHPILTELQTLDPNHLTPIQAHQKLHEWKNRSAF